MAKYVLPLSKPVLSDHN